MLHNAHNVSPGSNERFQHMESNWIYCLTSQTAHIILAFQHLVLVVVVVCDDCQTICNCFLTFSVHVRCSTNVNLHNWIWRQDNGKLTEHDLSAMRLFSKIELVMVCVWTLDGNANALLSFDARVSVYLFRLRLHINSKPKALIYMQIIIAKMK